MVKPLDAVWITDPLDKRWIADYVKEHNLKTVNTMDEPVIPSNNFYAKYGKRFLDFNLAIVACAVTLPVNIVLGICTLIDLGTPLFFLQKRVGKNCELFTIVKFRNMKEGVDKNGFWLPIEERVTKFGAFVRRTSLDELLNFYSILKGDMSFIGPRPLPEIYLDRYSERHKMRHAIRPGLECPDVKRKGYSIGWDEKLNNDIWYVENVSFLLDCKQILLLFKMVFDKKTRKQHAETGVGDFIGYDDNGKAFGAHVVPQKYIDLLNRHKAEIKESEK